MQVYMYLHNTFYVTVIPTFPFFYISVWNVQAYKLIAFCGKKKKDTWPVFWLLFEYLY